ncbi:MAG: hypothetical protein F6K58_11210 [Symploca sp. SIO2E9]|nr:hypothetical protein [Symploca sp. SIO2E9]
MRFKHFNLLSLVTFAAPVLISCIYGHTLAGELTVSGNCGKLNCEQLLAQLKINWSEQISQYTAECQSGKTLGLKVWNRNDSKVVTLICWEDQDSSGTIYGTYLGLLPFPGDEATFASKWNCLNSDQCKNALIKLRNQYPEEIRQYEVECAIEAGELTLVIPQVNGLSEANVQCSFFVPNTQIDDDGDGVADGAIAKPTGVDITLGTLTLPE